MRTLFNLFEATFNPRIQAALLGCGLLITLTIFGFNAVAAQADAGPSVVAPGTNQEADDYLVHGLGVEDQKQAQAIQDILGM